MKKVALLSSSIVLLAVITAFVLQPRNGPFTLEEFGGQAWYLPCDGRLQAGVQYPLLDFTPVSAEPAMLNGLTLRGRSFTKITAKTQGEFFPADIVGKRFCGLFAHQNPAMPNYDRVDEFYPQELGSRYATVVARLDGRNVLVDFEYNGGNTQKPQKITNGKGYFFFDNSEAWDKLRQAHTARSNRTEEIKLQGFAINTRVQALYVIPQYNTWQFTPTHCKIWSGTKNIPALKIGYEDYYQHEKAFGKSVINQPRDLFRLPGGEHDHNLIVNIKLYPPHRTVLESATFFRNVFVWRKAGGVTALVGATQLDEERHIKAGIGLTNETFICWGFSGISGGGSLTDAKDGVLQDIKDFGYVLCKDYEQRAPYFTTMNGHAGNFLVVENANLDFENQNAIHPSGELLQICVTQGNNVKRELPETAKASRDALLPFVFEISGAGNFFKVFALGGSNRTNILAFDGKSGVYTFLANAQGVRSDNPGELVGYWEYAYVNGTQKYDWGWKNGVEAIPGRTSARLIPIEQIPEKGKRYTISRDYVINESFEQLIDATNAKIATVNKDGRTASRRPQKGFMYSNVVRTAVAWTTVLNKYAVDINPAKDVPANGKPLALQPGDKFKIPRQSGSNHNPNEVYTVMRKDRGLFPMLPAEFVGIKDRSQWSFVAFSNAQSYRFFWCELDKDLPPTLGITFEIEMVESGSEELLDGNPRQAWHTYKGIGKIGQNGTGLPNLQNAQGKGGYGLEAKFHSPQFSEGEPLGHLCYSQVELTEWYKNVNWNNGYYRQNTNSGRGFETYEVKNADGKPEKVNPLARYSAGKTFINCTGGPVGQYSDRLNDFQVRDWIQQSNRKPLPENQKAKMRLYNSPQVRTQGLKEPEKYLETYPTDKGAPDMPRGCEEVLNGLIIK